MQAWMELLLVHCCNCSCLAGIVAGVVVSLAGVILLQLVCL